MLNQFVNSIVDAGREWLYREKNNESGESIKALCLDLLQAKGEATSAALAFDIVKAYRELDQDGRTKFFNTLASDFDLDVDALIESAKAYKEQKSPKTLGKLMLKSESTRQELFRRINQARNGTALLVGMRGELLSGLKSHPEWALVDLDIEHLLSSWFNRGFLRVRRIDWRSPAIILEKLMDYESVHTIKGWDDLRRRLADDRRCYAFFHPVMRDDPLIFVEIALVQGLANSVIKIIEPDSTILPVEDADTAIFYSINNCQKGLRGISFGDFLIKQVVSEIQKETPNITSFATLSPVPGFRKWLAQEAANENSVVLDDDSKQLITDMETTDWLSDKEACKTLKSVLTALCAHYLTEVRTGGKPYDPVARFHLHNGAQLNRINWLGDLSANGISQSFGILVNYVYDTAAIERNHEDYVHHDQIAVSDAVKRLAKKAREKASGAGLRALLGVNAA